MASTQISRIQVRRGLQENLPNLAAGELGWAVDSRRLFIGNGPTTEGAPAEGVTEILTEFVDISNFISAVTTANSGSFTLSANQAMPTATSLTVSNLYNGATVEYVMSRNVSGTNHIRKGVFRMGHLGSNYTFEDDFAESANIGVTLGFANLNVSNSAMTYISANLGGNNTTFSYTITSQL